MLEQARRTSARTVNLLMTAAYWEIGRRIVQYEQQGKARAEYGEALIARLSADLTTRFGCGFSARNVSQMAATPPRDRDPRQGQHRRRGGAREGVVAGEGDLEARLATPGVSYRPVLRSEPGDVAEVTQVSSQQEGVRHQGHARDSKIQSGKADPLLAQGREAVLSLLGERDDVHLVEPSPHGVQLRVSVNHFGTRAGPAQVGHPPLHLLLEADDRRGDVIRRELAQADCQAIALGLALTLKDGEVIRVEQDGHLARPLPISFANRGPEAQDLVKCAVVLEGPDNLAPPRRSLVPRDRGLELSELPFQPGKAALDLARLGCHGVLQYPQIVAEGGQGDFHLPDPGGPGAPAARGAWTRTAR
ncbi:MAG: hypothetical protein HY721_33755 [Planctomycetes bacterium]|nr:hypothetical protein [Planctomycetota bacterium]